MVVLGNPLYPKELGNMDNKGDTIVMDIMLVSSIQITFQAHPLQNLVSVVLIHNPAFSSCLILCDSCIHEASVVASVK